MEQLAELDRELFIFLNNLGNPTWDDFWNFVTNKWASIPFYALLVYFIYDALGWKKTLVTLVLVALVITCTDQLANVFKDYFGRRRPCREEGVMEATRIVAEYCGRFGYFSAHAASSSALAVYLGYILRPYWKNIFPVLIFWASLVSYSRIYVGVHYPGDVLTGILIGIFLGFLFYKLQQFLVKKYFSNPVSSEHRNF